MTGVFISQLAMIALLGIKKAPIPAALVAPLPFLSVAYWAAVRRIFWKPLRVQALLNACDADTRDEMRVSSLCLISGAC